MNSQVYFARHARTGEVKIGVSTNVARRLQSLSSSEQSDVVLLSTRPGTREDEAALHASLAKFNTRGEWFSPSPKVMREAARNIPGAIVVPDREGPTIRVRWDAIRDLRKAKGLDLDADLAAAMGIDAGNYSRVASGKQCPGARFIAGMSLALGAPMDDLFEAVAA